MAWEKLSGLADGTNGVVLVAAGGFGGFDGVGGVEWWRRMVASMASMGGIDDGDWGLRHRGH